MGIDSALTPVIPPGSGGKGQPLSVAADAQGEPAVFALEGIGGVGGGEAVSDALGQDIQPLEALNIGVVDGADGLPAGHRHLPALPAVLSVQPGGHHPGGEVPGPVIIRERRADAGGLVRQAGLLKQPGAGHDDQIIVRKIFPGTFLSEGSEHAVDQLGVYRSEPLIAQSQRCQP